MSRTGEDRSTRISRILGAAWADAPTLAALDIDLFLDTAELSTIEQMGRDPRVKGFTTNAALMRKAGVREYREFAARAIGLAQGRPISFPALADDVAELEREARLIAGWGEGVFVKLPVNTSRGASTAAALRRLVRDGIAVNVTAVMTLEQVALAVDAVADGSDAIVSVFAGRVADSGRDPVPLLRAARELVDAVPRCRLLWGSARESYNVFQAATSGCHIATLPAELWTRLSAVGRDPAEMSREAVGMFKEAADEAGYHVGRPLAATRPVPNA